MGNGIDVIETPMSLSCAERPDYLPDCLVIVHTRRDYLGGGDYP